MGLLIQETWVNKTEHYTNGDSDVYESRFEKPGEVYRYGLKEYGRCLGHVFVDQEGKTKKIGWVYEKIAHYEDTHEPYKLETWVVIHEKMPITTRQEFLKELE